MKKDYTLSVKYDVGDTVWVVETSDHNDKAPKVFTGVVDSIRAYIHATEDDGSHTTSLPITQVYRLRIAGAYHLDHDFFEPQLLTKTEARKRYETYVARLAPFSDTYIKNTIKKAQEFLKEYDK